MGELASGPEEGTRHSPLDAPIPLRQSLSLNLGLVFSQLVKKSASLTKPPVSALLDTGVTGVHKSLDLLQGCWDLGA